MHYFYDPAVILVSLLATLGLTVWMRRLLIKHALLDRPNERSSHTMPVPRGGGWALMIVLIPGMLITALTQNDLISHTGLIVGTVVLVLISWFDDRKGVSIRARLSLQIFAACVGSLAFPPQDMIFGGLVPFPLDRMLMIIGWVWFMNLYNFMDGIDGITGAETVAIATGTCLVITAAGIVDPFTSTLTLLLTGASLGFLALNWHPAKIFLGDVGSVPLGYMTGFILITLAVKGHLAAALILPLYHLADSGLTLTKRFLRGDKFWQAHREHFYQQAALGLGRHDLVVYYVNFANIALIGAALVTLMNAWLGLAMGVAIVAILLFALHKRSPVLPPRRDI